MTALYTLVAFVTLQRVTELVVARRNTKWLLGQGAVEVGRRHYPALVVLHTAWLGAILAFIPATAPLNPWLAAVYVALQGLRVWTIMTLGRRWTTRVICLPNAPLVRSGPYRFVKHPNYLIVVGEIAVLPLAFGAWRLALAFSLLNALVLFHRIRVEEQALGINRAASQ